MSGSLRLVTRALTRQHAFHTAAVRASSWPVTAPQQHESRPLTEPLPSQSKTLAHLLAMKQASIPIVCLTAYDYPSALAIRSADIDLCLVGDSLANVALGHSSTQSLTLDAVIHHCKAVMRGLNAPQFSSLPPGTVGAMPLVLADMPFGSTYGSVDSAVRNVVRLVQETGIDGVKIEGSHEIVPLVHALTSHGIPVMGHIGLQPQRVTAVSGYRVQAKTAIEAFELLKTAQALEAAGCCSLVLECIPTRVGGLVSHHTTIPMIGIGAGSKTDGQILVMNDMLGELTSPVHVINGLSSAPTQGSVTLNETDAATRPKFVRNFAGPSSLGALRMQAVQQYTRAIRDRSFPDDETEGYKIKTQEWRALLELVPQTTS